MDYAKPETIRPALHGVEKIFLFGPPVRDLPALEANFVKEVQVAGRKHIIKLSALRGACLCLEHRIRRLCAKA
jgi:uncharacterized protein YbjT (DUF2867 family)